MLTLSLNGNIIPIASDFSMQLTWKSPMCDFEKIPSAYGLGISFPINEYTRSIFGNPERFSKYRPDSASITTGSQKFPGFEVRFSGVLLMAGTLQVTSTTGSAVNGGTYEATLIDQLGILGEKEQERTLLDIPEFATPVIWIDSDNFNPDDHDYCCFPILNNGFFKDKGLKVTRQNPAPADGSDPGTYEIEMLTFLFVRTYGTVNEHDIARINYIGRIESEIQLQLNAYENAAGKVTVVSPFFFLNKMIRKALKINGFFIGADCIDADPSLRNICIYNNYDLTITEFITGGNWQYIKGRPTITYTESGGYVVEDNWQWIDVGGGNKIVQYNRSYPDVIIPKNHLPKMKVGELIISTQNLLNVCFHFLPNNTINVFSRDEILNNASVDLDTYFMGDWAIGEQKCVALKFTREHDDKDLIFSDRYHDLSDRKADIKAPVSNMEALQAIGAPAEGEIRMVTALNAFYEYRILTEEEVDPVTKATWHTDILGWKEISINLQNGWYEYGREEVEEIKSAWSACFEHDQYATADQSGSMNMMKDQEQSFSPRLLIRDHWSNNWGSAHTQEFSFEYEKPTTGILAKYWSAWNPFWANRLPVTGSFDLPMNVLRHVIWNICNKFRTREGEFLIEEMSCEIFVDRIGMTEIKGFKV